MGNDDQSIENFKIKLSDKEKIIKEYEDKIQNFDNELNYKNSQIDSFESSLSLKDAQVKNIESKLVNRQTEINNLNIQINSLKNIIGQKEEKFKNKENELINQVNHLKLNISKIEQNEQELYGELSIANNKLKNFNSQISNSANSNSKSNVDSNELNSIKRSYINNLSKLDNKEYCIKCYKDELKNNSFEIQYLKTNLLLKKFLIPFSYLYLIFKSNLKELIINFKLYKALKDSKCFDVGYYLNNNKDLQDSKWFKYFSLELHYVLKGFNEERNFNKKYFNRNSKKELLNYLLTCNY